MHAHHQGTARGEGEFPPHLCGCGPALAGTSPSSPTAGSRRGRGSGPAPSSSESLPFCWQQLGGRPRRLTTFPFGPDWPSIPVTPWMRLKEKKHQDRMLKSPRCSQGKSHPTRLGVLATCLRMAHPLGTGQGSILKSPTGSIGQGSVELPGPGTGWGRPGEHTHRDRAHQTHGLPPPRTCPEGGHEASRGLLITARAA